MPRTLGEMLGCTNQKEFIDCIKNHNNIPYEFEHVNKNKDGLTILKMVVEKVEEGSEHTGMFECPESKESYYYEKRKEDNRLIKVYASAGRDRDTRDVEFAELKLSSDELLFIEEQLNAKTIESVLSALKVKEIVDHDKKYLPVQESVTFKCFENDSEVTAHIYEGAKEAVFTVKYFSTYDSENRSLKLELDPKTKVRLKQEILLLLNKMEAQEATI